MWGLKERFRVAMEERSLKVKGAEEMECRAVRVREWFATVMHRSADICEQTDLVTLSGRHIYTEVRHQLNPPCTVYSKLSAGIKNSPNQTKAEKNTPHSIGNIIGIDAVQRQIIMRTVTQ
jgi:hypothetical protein